MSTRLRRLSAFASRIVVLVALVAVATSALALDVPPPPSQWVTDRAGILAAADAQALNQKLADFEQRRGAQFIIYIFPSLEGEALEDFTIRCAEKWKVGQKKYDNGLILFVFMQEKKIRIEVGYGLEPVITDAYSKRVISEIIEPRFHARDFAGGLNAGADALMARIEGKEAPVAPYQGSGQRPVRSGRSGGFDIGSIFFIIFVVFVFVILPMFGRRRSGCGGCFWPMMFLGGGNGFTLGGGGGGGWGGGGGFSGGGGSFGGGGASGGWS